MNIGTRIGLPIHTTCGYYEKDSNIDLKVPYNPTGSTRRLAQPPLKHISMVTLKEAYSPTRAVLGVGRGADGSYEPPTKKFQFVSNCGLSETNQT